MSDTKTFDKLSDDELLAYAEDWLPQGARDSVLFHFIDELKTRVRHYRNELDAANRTSERLGEMLDERNG